MLAGARSAGHLHFGFALLGVNGAQRQVEFPPSTLQLCNL
jgi:hypothetical protein